MNNQKSGMSAKLKGFDPNNVLSADEFVNRGDPYRSDQSSPELVPANPIPENDVSGSTTSALATPKTSRQKRLFGGGRGRKKKLVRPWEEVQSSTKERMQLLIDPADKVRLDFLAENTNMAAQRILRMYIKDALAEDAEELFMQLSPESGPPKTEI